MQLSKKQLSRPEVTKDSIADFISGRGLARVGFRAAVVQGILDNEPIKKLSDRHRISRQGIYGLIDRINAKGFAGLEESEHTGRKSQLTEELSAELKEVLLNSPSEFGYIQSRWDGPLLIKYLEEYKGIRLGHSQVNIWIHELGFTLQRGRQKYTKADEKAQERFKEDLKKTEESG